MASIIPGYNYDIFISYRQKDNKGDHWVSNFVEALKTELESTFKEEIGVYFDVNPHDGLLEIHDVDESLKEKLKCLIFIPIISRTYCDPKSFAWEHEFKAFVEMASKDKYGLKVKLPNGNVASRVLPVQIHDIDEEDRKCVEETLGGHIRGIEFIYKEPGVDRPLNPEDNEEKNLYSTKYKNQINKVANGIRGIITGLRNPAVKSPDPERKRPLKVHKQAYLRFLFIFSVALGILLFAGTKYLFVHNNNTIPESSIAVLPFKNDSPEDKDVYFINGFQDEIITNLQSIKSFNKVLPSISVDKYRNTQKTIPEMAKELDVNYIISGSGQKIDNAYRLRITLTNAQNKIIWGHAFEGVIERDIFKTHVQIAEAIARELNAAILPNEKKSIIKSPVSLTAYDFYWQGKEEYTKYWRYGDVKALERAESILNKALGYDSTLAIAYTGLARVYYDKSLNRDYYSENFLDTILVLCNTAVSLDENIADAYVLRGDYFRDKGNKDKSLEEYDKALQINPNCWEAYDGKGRLFWSIDQVKMIENFEKAASLNHGAEFPDILAELVIAYYNSGFPERALFYADSIYKLTRDSLKFLKSCYNIEYDNDLPKALRIAEKIIILDSISNNKSYPGYHSLYTPGPLFYFYVANGYRILGNDEMALRHFRKEIEISKKYPDSPIQPGSEHRIGYAYWFTGDTTKAKKIVREALEKSLKIDELGRGMSLVEFTSYDIAADYAFLGQKKKAYEYLKKFSEKVMMPLDILGLIKMDPLFDNLRGDTQFQDILKDLENKYLAEHERVKKWLSGSYKAISPF